MKHMNMKTLKIIASILLISSFLMSCGNTSKNKPATDAESLAEQSETISLNEGEKWMVNDEMKPFIQAAKSALVQHLQSDNTDHRELAAQLKGENSRLIKSCTMQGESHDELHKWLLPHIELIDALSKATSTEEADDIIASLQSSFSTYNQYFQ